MPFPFDDNIRNYLRMNSMFGGDMGQNEMAPGINNGMRDINMIPEDNDQLDLDYFKSRMDQLYQPDTRMTDRFNNMLESQPQRGNPSTWRKIAAIGSSFAGPQAVERTLYPQYNREMQDWMTGIKPVQEAANLEKGNNANLRAVANQVLSQESGQRRLERQIERDRVLKLQGDTRLGNQTRTVNQNDRRLDQTDRRLDQADVLRHEVDDNGRDVLVMRDGSIVDIEGLDYLSAEAKAALKKRYSTTGNRPRFRTEVVQDRNNPNGPGILVKVNLDTDEVTPLDWGGPGNTPKPEPGPIRPVVKESSVTQQTGDDKAITAKANDFIAKNSRLGKYVKVDKQGKVTISPPSRLSDYGIGITEAERQQIYRAIYGSQGPGAQGTVLSSGKRADGKVHVKRKSDGATGWVTNPDKALYDIIP